MKLSEEITEEELIIMYRHNIIFIEKITGKAWREL